MPDSREIALASITLARQGAVSALKWAWAPHRRATTTGAAAATAGKVAIGGVGVAALGGAVAIPILAVAAVGGGVGWLVGKAIRLNRENKSLAAEAKSRKSDL